MTNFKGSAKQQDDSSSLPPHSPNLPPANFQI